MSGGAYRLPSGGRIDRGRVLRFTFDGRRLEGFAGDTLASALIASGVRVVARSFKLHRPRGIFTAGAEEPNALVQIGDGACAEPNARATLVVLDDDLRARSQNRWPSLSLDFGALLGLASPLTPAGFYYKTFKWPSWRWYEWAVRRSVGLGELPDGADPDRYQKRNAHCDVLIAGAGPAGLAAALAAGESGARVIIADMGEEFGGSLLWEKGQIGDRPAAEWAQWALACLGDMAEVIMLPRAQVSGYYDHDVVTIEQRVRGHGDATGLGARPRQRFWKVRAKRVILATGAIERPLVFPDNDRPGVMLASAVRHYVNRFAVAPGRRVVIATNNDDAYRTALDLAAAGVEVVAVVDGRENPIGELCEQVRAIGIEIVAGAAPVGTRGRKSLTSVTVAKLAGARGKSLPKRVIACDVLAISGGWNPVVHLFSQSGGRLRYDDERACFVPATSVQHERSVGAANGTFALSGCLDEGFRAGAEAARATGLAPAGARPDAVTGEPTETPMLPLWEITTASPGKQWIDYLFDVTRADVALAARENFVSVEHLKRYTTTGMAADQGKTSNVNALAAMAVATGRAVGEVGTTRFRPPYHPVTLGSFAGRRRGGLYAPRRLMPAHDRHAAAGALFEELGGWQRPACYPRDGETGDAAASREVLAVRGKAGLFDASPLGKIEVRGRDAGEFLEGIYFNSVTSLAKGRVRYGFMLNENGVIIDDGVLARLDDHRFVVFTSSGAAGRIELWLEEWLGCGDPAMEVVVTAVTTQWAAIALSGPAARRIVEKLETDIDLGAEAFPHMAVREGLLCGVPARVLRVSLTGEMTFEINVPAGYGPALWQRLMAAGSELGLTAVGIRAIEILRAEKGHLIVGIDSDGGTTPPDVGWHHVLARKEADFIGRRSLLRPENVKQDRLQLVGLESAGGEILPVGGQVVDTSPAVAPVRTQGFVTTSLWSPTLERPVALGLVEGGRARHGEAVAVLAAGKTAGATIIDAALYDPRGERLNG